MNFKIKNIWEHLQTTMIAIVVFVITAYFVDQGKATFTEVWPAWAAVIYFAFVGKIKPPAAPIILMLIPLFLFSCSPQKRLARIVKNNPELIQTIHDTVRIDTFVVIAPLKETFALPIVDDTIHIQGSTFNLDFYRDVEKDTFYINVETIPDTVFIEIEKLVDYSNIEVNQVTEEKHNFISDTKLILGMILGIIFLILIIKLTK